MKSGLCDRNWQCRFSRFFLSFPTRAHAVFLLVLFVVAGLSVEYLSLNLGAGTWRAFPTMPFLDGWARWDSGWFNNIAENGYFFDKTGASSVAFFPLYAILMRHLGSLLGDNYLAGILITVFSGFAISNFFFQWTKSRLGVEAAKWSCLALLIYPFSFFIAATAYSDALFIFFILLSFHLLEKDHPWAAGVIGALATATRAMGIALCVGLLIRVLEKRGVFGVNLKESREDRTFKELMPQSISLKNLSKRDFGVITSVAGLLAYCLYLHFKFGSPLLFAEAITIGWNSTWNWQSFFKIPFFANLQDGFSLFELCLIAHALLAFLMIALIPRVFRVFGWGYGLFTFFTIFIPFLKSPDFFGLGRYYLPAFPCFCPNRSVPNKTAFLDLARVFH